MNNLTLALISLIRKLQPVSPFALSSAVIEHGLALDAKTLRAALRAALASGAVKLDTDNYILTVSVESPLASTPSSVPDGDDQGSSTAHPTPAPDSPQSPQPSPTDPSTSASHPAVQTESQTLALRYAIQTEVELLSRLEGELRTFLRDARRYDADKVRPAASALLRKAASARREYEESDKYLRDSQLDSTTG